MTNIAACYVSIPFCETRCAFCDFNTYAGLSHLRAEYVEALITEIRSTGYRYPNLHVPTIYLGGGTGTLLSPAQIGAILTACHAAFEVALDAEITIETHPLAVDGRMLAELRALGVNRLSFGVQSFDERELRLLGRTHSPDDVRRAVVSARTAGFDNLSLDLMFGLPGQSLERWAETLDRALALEPDHLSGYSLQVEEHTALAVQIARGRIAGPDADLAAEMYEFTQARLAGADFAHYEISNWAKAGKASRHNLTYWLNDSYLGLGAGAHGWMMGHRTENMSSPKTYIAQAMAGQSCESASEPISRIMEMGETMMLGLRLIQSGVSRARYHHRFGVDPAEAYASAIADLKQLGLLEMDDERLRLTKMGRLLGNEAFARFLPDDVDEMAA